MAYTIEQYEALESAYAQGVTSVSYGDKSVTYRSLDEMSRILYRMRRALGLDKPQTHVYPSISKGLSRRRRC